MLLAVQFNDELGRVAVEIDDEPIERDLAAEFRAVKARIAQASPKDLLGPGRLLPQQFRKFAALRSLGLSILRSVPSPPTPLGGPKPTREQVGAPGVSARRDDRDEESGGDGCSRAR